MRKFAANEMIMRTKESKRTVKTYNTVAKALVAFETLWLRAWRKSIEDSKAGLQATLIVRHPETGNLLVNFDKEIMQLMRETKYLQRMGIEVPGERQDGAVAGGEVQALLQPALLRAAEYDRVMSDGGAGDQGLLGPHLRGLGEPPPARDVLADVDVHEHRRVPACASTAGWRSSRSSSRR